MNDEYQPNSFLPFLFIAGVIVALGLALLGCTSTLPPATSTVSVRPVIGPRCAETAPEVPQMRAACNSTMLSPSRVRQACAFVTDFEDRCQ